VPAASVGSATASGVSVGTRQPCRAPADPGGVRRSETDPYGGLFRSAWRCGGTRGARTVSGMTSAIERFAGENYVSLTTYRQDGTGVPTAVWCAVDGDALYIWTATDTWKVKRIRRRADVTVAACSRLGKIRSEPIRGRAEICDAAGSDRTRQLIKQKYGWFGRLSVGLSVWRRGRDGSVGLRVTFPAV
jgi:PPOX class probable F420-dependent enzyme